MLVVPLAYIESSGATALRDPMRTQGQSPLPYSSLLIRYFPVGYSGVILNIAGVAHIESSGATALREPML